MIYEKLIKIDWPYMRVKLTCITKYFCYLTCEALLDPLTTYNNPLKIFEKSINEQIRDLGI